MGGHSIQGVTHSSYCIVRSQWNAYILSDERVCYAHAGNPPHAGKAENNTIITLFCEIEFGPV